MIENMDESCLTGMEASVCMLLGIHEVVALQMVNNLGCHHLLD
jgi:hypothetical protein